MQIEITIAAKDLVNVVPTVVQNVPEYAIPIKRPPQHEFSYTDSVGRANDRMVQEQYQTKAIRAQTMR